METTGIAIGIREDAPEHVALVFTSGATWQLQLFLEPDGARELASALLDVALSLEMGTPADRIDTLIQEINNNASALASEEELDKPFTRENVDATIEKHPCPHCGAEDNYRCCEFGRDKR